MFAPRSGPFLLAAAVGLALLAVVRIVLMPAGWGSFLVTAILILATGVWLFLAWFFRDPERAAGPGVVSAADGKVQSVTREDGRLRVSVFMNVTDVHVNRFPLDGEIRSIVDAGSGFRPAYAPEASHNRRRHYLLATELGEVEVVQMTGILARRLVSFVAGGERRKKGERLGMIVLGSRVDVVLPAHRVDPLVRAGDRVRAGITTIARERP